MKKIDKESLEDLTRRANNGDVHSQFVLAEIYHLGNEIEKDYKKAYYWVRKAALQGHEEAQHKLGVFYLHGYGVEKNYEKAYIWFEQAAIKDNLSSQLELAQIYFEGIGVPKDFQKAFVWAFIAYDTDLMEKIERFLTVEQVAEAKKISRLVKDGEYDVDLEREHLTHWEIREIRELTAKAQEGDADAQLKLFDIYEGSFYHSPYRIQKAWYWLKRAAYQGHVEAQYDLGGRYYLGRHPKQSSEKAYIWWVICSTNPSEKTARLLEDIEILRWIDEYEKTITPQQKQRAQRKIERIRARIRKEGL